MGDGGPIETSPTIVTLTCSSAMTCFSVAVTYSGFSSGSTRQFTFAAASCGSAFFAWPPSSWVATHVVRSVAFHAVVARATRSMASASPSAAFARSLRTGPSSIFAIARKYACVTSLVFSGNANFDSRSSAPAR